MWEKLGMNIAFPLSQTEVFFARDCQSRVEVSSVTSVNSKSDETQEIKFVNTLKEDLKTLEISWNNERLSKKKVARHFLEILNSFSEVAQAEFLEAFEPLCDNLEEHLVSVANDRVELWEEAWTLTAELIDLLIESLQEGSVESDKIEELHTRITQETDSKEFVEADSSQESIQSAENELSADDGEVMHAQEESIMVDDGQVDPKELLAKAQEALLSGKGDNAKEFALKAAELIAAVEAEEARKRQEALSFQLENITREESEAETFVSETKERTAELEKDLAAFNKRLADARAAYEQRENECQEIKNEIEKNEEEMAALKEKQRELHKRFEEAAPARDAAKRECAKVESESKDLPSDVEILRENLAETEKRLKDIRQQKAEIEAELATLNEKLAG
jgi:DNA repair exonuclease SbcCD ATPase subunit